MKIDINPNAPISAKYIVQQADGILTNEQALSALSTGIMKVTTTTGAITTAAAGTDYAAPNQTMYIGTTAVAINRASAALTLAGLTLTTPDIGTPSAGVLTNCSGTAASLTAGAVTNATLSTALTVDTGTLTLTANVANTSVLTIGAGASSISGANTGDQTNISGNAATVTVDATTSDTTCFVLLGESDSGSLEPQTDATLTYNASTSSLAATTFVGALTGTASGNLVSGGALGTPSGGTLTSCTGLPAAAVLAGSLGTGAYVMDSSLQVVSIELGHATDTTLARSAAGAITVEGVAVPTISSTSTLTNKRITKRVVTTADDATAVIDVDVTDVYELSAVANITEFTLTGTPTDGQMLIVRVKDAGTTKGLTWTGFTAIGVTLPATTTVSKWHVVGCMYNLAVTQWQAVAVTEEA